jgi:hypothetical protein
MKCLEHLLAVFWGLGWVRYQFRWIGIGSGRSGRLRLLRVLMLGIWLESWLEGGYGRGRGLSLFDFGMHLRYIQTAVNNIHCSKAIVYLVEIYSRTAFSFILACIFCSSRHTLVTSLQWVYLLRRQRLIEREDSPIITGFNLLFRATARSLGTWSLAVQLRGRENWQQLPEYTGLPGRLFEKSYRRL